MEPASAIGGDTLVVVRIPFGQDSVAYRAYAEPLLEGTVFEWAFSRFVQEIPANVPVICVCSTVREYDQLFEPCRKNAFILVRRDEPTEARQCRKLMDDYGVARIVSFRLAHALLPVSRVFRAVMQIHRAVGATVTEAAAKALPVPVCVIDPTAVDWLLGAEDSSEQQALHHAIERARALTNAPTMATIAAGWFQASLPDVLQIPEDRWPEHMWLDTSSDVRVLREVLGGSGVDAVGSGSHVEAWKAATIALRRIDRARDAEAVPKRTPRDVTEGIPMQERIAQDHVPQEYVASAPPASASMAAAQTDIRPGCSTWGLSRGTETGCRSRTQRRRILYISATSYFHGASQSLCHLIDGLNRARYEPVILVGYSGQLTEQLRRRGVELIVPNDNIETLGERSLTLATRLVREVAPDVAHGNYIVGAPLVAALAAANVPLVQHVRTASMDPLSLEIHQAAAIVAVSNLVKRRLASFDVDPADIDVIWPGIDTAYFRPRPQAKTSARDRLGVPATDFVVAAIGRMSRYKHHETVVAAVGHLRRQIGRGHLLFVSALDGDRDYYNEVFERIRQEGLSSHVTHIEFTSEVPTILHASDTLVMMSKNEAFGRVAAEAMSAGLPVVAGDLTGVAEVIQHGHNGFIVPGQDPLAVATLLAQMAADPVRMTKLGEAAEATVEAHLSAKRAAERTMAVYDRVLGERRRVSPGIAQPGAR